MEMDKVLNLNDDELVHHERQAAEQVFRLRFQMRMGQNEGLKKLRGLRKDIARIKTAQRQRELGLISADPANASGSAKSPKASAKSHAQSSIGAAKQAKKSAGRAKPRVKAKTKTTGKAKTKTAAKVKSRSKGNTKSAARKNEKKEAR